MRIASGARGISHPMPQIFCLARSIAKSKPGETPLTQMTAASQATALRDIYLLLSNKYIMIIHFIIVSSLLARPLSPR